MKTTRRLSAAYAARMNSLWRELIGLHMSEQEGMMLPTAKQFTEAVDALAQAIGAADQHPRERTLEQDATCGMLEVRNG